MKSPHPRKTDTLNRIEMDLLDPRMGLSVADEIGVRRYRIKEIEVPKDQLVRVKAVLRFPVDGIEESYFQLAETIDNLKAQPLTQFRMKGVSKQGAASKWTYSNLVTSDGERVIFQLLAELADNMDWLSDKDIEFLLESFANDLYLERIIEQKTGVIRTHDFYETVKQAIKEELVQAVSALKSFREELRMNPQEIAVIYKQFTTQDLKNSRQDDFLETVLTSYLQEKMELHFAENLQAYGEGDNPFAYIEDLYDFIIQGEFLQEEWSPFADDHVFFRFRDIASLLSDPVVQEIMRVTPSDSFSQSFLFALSTMMDLNEDSLVLDLFQLVDDAYEQLPSTPSILLEQEENKLQLLYEVLALVFEQSDQHLNVNPEIVSHFMHRFRQVDQRLFLTRSETEKVDMARTESIQRKDTMKPKPSETIISHMREGVTRKGGIRKRPTESMTSGLSERFNQVISDWRNMIEQVGAIVSESWQEQYTHLESIAEVQRLIHVDRLMTSETAKVSGTDELILRLASSLIVGRTLEAKRKDIVKGRQFDRRHVLYQFNPGTRGSRMLSDRLPLREIDYTLLDKFVPKDYEFVQFALGEEYDGMSVGTKTLGDIIL